MVLAHQGAGTFPGPAYNHEPVCDAWYAYAFLGGPAASRASAS
jgi:hypothetical protein